MLLHAAIGSLFQLLVVFQVLFISNFQSTECNIKLETQWELEEFERLKDIMWTYSEVKNA